MNILHITHTDIRFDNRIIKEIEALSIVEGYNLLGVGISFDEGGAENQISHIRAEIRTLKLWSRKLTFLFSPIRHALTFFELFFRTINIARKFKPEVIHCHDTLVLPIGYFLRFINRNAKLIYDAHELESNKNGQTRILSKITFLIEKFSWSKVDCLITVSPSIFTWYEKKLGSKYGDIILNSPKLSNVPSTGKDSYNDVSSKYFHSKYNIEPDKLVFIYVGALTQGRCIETMIEAFSASKINSHLVFVGFGPLKDFIIDSSARTKNVHYHEPVSHDKVVDIVRNADIGMCLIENISLSDYYCLPNKLFEYSFSNLPILGSNFPDIVNVIDEYKLGKYCEINLDSIRQTILSIENEPLVFSEKSLQPLSWENQALKLRNIYDKIN